MKSAVSHHKFAVNFNKCSLSGVNIHSSFLNGMIGYLNCKRGTWPMNFLGIPMGSNYKRMEVWKDVLFNMSKRLASWEGRFISFAGQVVLINAMLNALSLYLFSFHRASQCVIREFTKIQRYFLYGGVGRPAQENSLGQMVFGLQGS
ncbi:hypothetical protein Lal_00021154 [Lupinus albus]|nr:hypothetical protein Lal_00021154 [Lupinus albus]